MTRKLLPRLRYRAHEAWERAKTSAQEAGEAPPPDEDAVLSHKPCLRRMGEWARNGSRLDGLQEEALPQYQGAPPWQKHDSSTIRFSLDLPRQTTKTDPPDKRREAALEALAQHPGPDCTIWSDGSAREGTTRGGGGALIQLHREQRTLERMAPAGLVCSSTRAELMAMAEALQCVADLPPLHRREHGYETSSCAPTQNRASNSSVAAAPPANRPHWP